MALLSNLFSKATGSLPLFKISKWDIMVLKGEAPKRASDEDITTFKGALNQAIDRMADAVRDLQDAIAGIFQGSTSKYETIAKFDSFVSFNGSRNTEIVQNAIEMGSFRTVNKIQRPATCVVELAKGGYRSEVESCLWALKEVNKSLALCRIVTPFGSMDNMNLIKLDYSYTKDNGANLLVAKMTFQEVRYGSIKAGYKDVKVKAPQDADKKQTGLQAKQLLRSSVRRFERK